MHGAGNDKAEKSSVRLHEIGPRLTMSLVKIEQGVCEADVLYHEATATALAASHLAAAAVALFACAVVGAARAANAAASAHASLVGSAVCGRAVARALRKRGARLADVADAAIAVALMLERAKAFVVAWLAARREMNTVATVQDHMARRIELEAREPAEWCRVPTRSRERTAGAANRRRLLCRV